MIKEFKSHTDSITCIQFNHSDVHVASGSLSGDVLIHSLLSAQTVSTMTGTDSQPIRNLQYSPHHKTRLATVGDYGRVVVWETSERSVVAEFDSHSGPAHGVAFSPINKLLLASAGLDKQLLFYDINDKKVIKSIDCEQPLTGLTFYEDGVTVAAGTVGGDILVYDLRRGSSPTAKFSAHPGVEVSGVAFQRTKAGSSKSSTKKPAETPGGSSVTPAATPVTTTAKEAPVSARTEPPVEPKAPKEAWAEPVATPKVVPDPVKTPLPAVPMSPPRSISNPLYGEVFMSPLPLFQTLTSLTSLTSPKPES